MAEKLRQTRKKDKVAYSQLIQWFISNDKIYKQALKEIKAMVA